ncbi:hypothetical protein JQ633_05080 [Bradyrhizobium tropiciagri]|uniref:hypothetical protein n=1 Tax=Bradyrhizobium tropiciagri TaxID=312253 RepID=UPI001BAD11A3|nr:hypothetical protein [Bradyrhizobium tropiciagri]MBR0869722.1 hypothetical protein [Bradyrhizobium tropiciagri]
MPLARYFMYVGGALLALLFLLDANLPKLSVAERPSAVRPAIRILSLEKLPDLIVYDTTLPTIIPERVAELPVTVLTENNEISSATRNRDAFAQMQVDVERRRPPGPRMREARQPRKHARHRRYAATPYAFFAERRPRFAWFENRIW